MNTESEQPDVPPSRSITFAAGGWVILLAVVLTAGVFAWRVIPLIRAGRSEAIGDGRNVSTYGFDLATCRIPRDRIVASGMPKDGLPSLDRPPRMPGRNVQALNERIRGKYLVPRDRVIGIRIQGEARAYPIRVLNWHEIVNDELAGMPIAVTYSPLCDSAAVFDRRVGGVTRTFGVSGLLYNSNLLMYDRCEDANEESLWSQLRCEAVTGPSAEAGDRLTVLPAQLMQWGDWLAANPDTDVLQIDLVHIKKYNREPYGSYYGSEELRFPVRPLPPESGPQKKTPVMILVQGDRRSVFSLTEIAKRVAGDGVWQAQVGSTMASIRIRPDPVTAIIDLPPSDDPIGILHAFWFAWYAMHPSDPLLPADASS
jgi:hypothetical protein